MGQDTVNFDDAVTDTVPAMCFRKSLNGAISHFVSTMATYPLYKTVFRQQLHNTLVWEAMAQLYGEGLRKLFRGFAPPLLGQTFKGALVFGVQGELYRHSSHLVPDLPRPLLQAAAGVGTGVVEALVFTPFERVQNVLQNGKNDHHLPTHRSVLVRLSSEPLALGFYRALLPIIARNALGSGLFFGLKDPVRDALDRQGLPTTASSFTSGAVNSLFISLVVYPLSALVANMQAGVGQEDAGSGLKESARKLWASRQGSVALLYRGLILRSVSWGITTAIYDQLKRD